MEQTEESGNEGGEIEKETESKKQREAQGVTEKKRQIKR